MLIAFIMFGGDLGLIAWPFSAAAVICGLFAWWLYDVDGAERALLRGMIASVLVAVTVYAVTLRLLPSLFPSAMISENISMRECRPAHVASTFAYQEPSLVFLSGTDTRFTDGPGRQTSCGRAMPFLLWWICAARRAFAQRAEFDRIALFTQPAV